jgi:hypothetical protein
MAGSEIVLLASNTETVVLGGSTETVFLADNEETVTVGPVTASTYGYLESLGSYAALEAFTYGQLEQIL